MSLDLRTYDREVYNFLDWLGDLGGLYDGVRGIFVIFLGVMTYQRYDTYMKTTKPVLDFYSKNMNFHEIDGSLKIDQITNKIDDFINV